MKKLKRIIFKNKPSKDTPLNDVTLNKIQDNTEEFVMSTVDIQETTLNTEGSKCSNIAVNSLKKVLNICTLCFQANITANKNEYSKVGTLPQNFIPVNTYTGGVGLYFTAVKNGLDYAVSGRILTSGEVQIFRPNDASVFNEIRISAVWLTKDVDIEE